MVGKYVIARSSASGVWAGVCQSIESDGPGTERVILSEARRIHYWTGAGSCSGLAAHGPSGGRIAIPVDARVSGCCEILAATPEAESQIRGLPEWRP